MLVVFVGTRTPPSLFIPGAAKEELFVCLNVELLSVQIPMACLCFCLF